jgi:hypothetical protein
MSNHPTMRLCETCRGSISGTGPHSCAGVFAARAEHLREALDRALERLEDLTNAHEELRSAAMVVLSRLPEKSSYTTALRLSIEALRERVRS